MSIDQTNESEGASSDELFDNHFSHAVVYFKGQNAFKLTARFLGIFTKLNNKDALVRFVR